ncbi:MAG: YajG family lipoprotein [Kangiellaceae bacterium]
MKNSIDNRLLFPITLIFSTFIFACTPSKLYYQIDPDFSKLQSTFENKELIYVAVNDHRHSEISSPDRQFIEADIPDAQALKTKLIQHLKDNDFKIINRVLLADAGLELNIKVLNLSLDSGVFKNELVGKSELEIIVHKKSNRWSKSYKASRTQEIASPINEFDTTGVINQMLSKQLNHIFSDEELINFIAE